MIVPTFSLVLNHAPWKGERVEALDAMKSALFNVDTPLARHPHVYVNDVDYRGKDWQKAKVDWALDQWRWSSTKPVSHHVFMTDDLHLAPRFWKILEAMIRNVPDTAIGLLSNHPKAPELAAKNIHGYRTNAWLVGPAYVLPHALLLRFLEWFEKLPNGTAIGCKGYANDDSSLNEWITHHGPREVWHPVPTIIEHRGDLQSTVGHGDEYSRERVSWREMRTTTTAFGTEEGFVWSSWGCAFDLDAMQTPQFWKTEWPLLAVGG